MANAAPSHTSVNVHFKKGAYAATYKGVIKGSQYNSYFFKAQKGQKLTVTVNTKENAEAVLYGYDNFMEGEAYTLPKSGKYEVRVLQPRAMARRGKTSHYNVTINIK
ncbi:inhibitor of g-type lysozyme [Pasteurellaceae bacterium HPA106]|nr:inhibitor of g-type lysozyme [Spirabiliibacterium pneumoniae]